MAERGGAGLARRSVLLGVGAAVVCGRGLGGQARAEEPAKQPEVTPAEDLMREHGIVRRVMMVYDDVRRRLAAGESVSLAPVVDGAALVRRVIEDYHEKLEEDYVFPRFRKAGRLVPLVDTLARQHDVGRRITDRLLALPRTPAPAASAEVVALLDGFDRMYRAHAAREDTVLFPALRKLVNDRTYARLGEQFEEVEERVLGEGGFDRAVEQVAEIERSVGLEDLSTLTATMPPTSVPSASAPTAR